MGDLTCVFLLSDRSPIWWAGLDCKSLACVGSLERAAHSPVLLPAGGRLWEEPASSIPRWKAQVQLQAYEEFF